MKFLVWLYGKIANGRIRGLIKRIILKYDGGIMYSNTIRTIYKKYHGIDIGYGTYGGCFSLSNIRPNIKIGRYCSIASRIDLLRANHPATDFTTHPIAHRTLFNYKLKSDRFHWSELIIGNDVWIGQNVVILPSCRFIGNGAIIGAGSIVTKDVAPYTIVAGNPAKKIKMRFSPETIQKLEESRWWELDKDDLIKKQELLEDIVNEKRP
ncbi:MAG: CatB-related O-acetyltransferase [Candidatus Azobacteroides sp.]|nr:CatB-related O-acetyltransferase [Candidatus Azobacteroides sp.]